MNCFNHTQEPAVAQCSDCGKGLCSECAERYQPILCTPCFQKRKRSEIWSGYLFVEKYIPYKMMAGTNGQWIVYYIVKLLLFVVIGVFTAPFTCLWAVFQGNKGFSVRGGKNNIYKEERI